MRVVDWDKNMNELTKLIEAHADDKNRGVTAGAAGLACATLLCDIGHELQNLVEEVARIRKGEH